MSNFPHSTSLSTSPYAYHNNIDQLIHRSRGHHNHPGHRPSFSLPVSGIETRPDQPLSGDLTPIGDDSEFLFPQDNAVLRQSQAPPSNAEVSSKLDQGSSHRVTRGWRAGHRNYGAVNSEPLIPSGQLPPTLIEDDDAQRGSSHSRRTRGRTPPRHGGRPAGPSALSGHMGGRILRPPASYRGSFGAPSTAPDDSGISVTSTADLASSTATADTEIGVPAINHTSTGRGRSQDRRPISPVVLKRALEPVPKTQEEEDAAEEEDVEIARATQSSWSGTAPAPMVDPFDGDPAYDLDAEDLDIATDGCGNEVHSWKGAFKNELWVVTTSTIPVFFTGLAEYSLQLASVVSIGHLGKTELAASTIASMTASVTGFSICQGLATALDTLLPAAWTSSEPSRVGLWTQRQFVVMTVAMVPMMILWLNSHSVFRALGQDPEVAEQASVYLAYMSIGLPGYAGNVILKKYLQSQNIMDVPTYILFIVAPINLLLNWAFVWGPKSIRMGLKGGAVATSISFNLTCILLALYIYFLAPRVAFHPFHLKSVFSKLGTVTSLGLAGTVMLSSEWWAWEVCALAASYLGPTALAAQSVLLSTCSTLYQFPAALGIASSVRVGNLLGAGRAWEAKWASRASFALAVAFALFNSSICIIFRNSWGYMFNSDAEVVALVADVLIWIAMFQVMDGMTGAANAVLRALALHAKGAVVNLTAYYVIGIPFGLWLTFNCHMGLVGIWIGLTIALFYSSTINVTFIWRTDWNKGVERVRRRLGLSSMPADSKYADDGRADEEPCTPGVVEQGRGGLNGSSNGDAERQPLLS